MGEVVVVVGVGAEVAEADNTSYPFCDLIRNDIYVMQDMSSNCPPKLTIAGQTSWSNDLLS